MKNPFFSSVATIFSAAHLCAAPMDLDSDGLPDVWQQQFGAENEIPSGDPDGDGHDNAAEAEAGTNPFDTLDRPALSLSASTVDPDTMELVFPTKAGKIYQFQTCPDLFSFKPFGPLIVGDGLPHRLDMTADAGSAISGNVIQYLWSNVPGNDINTLLGLPEFPASPDGASRLAELQTEPIAGSGFGGCLITLITPPQTGNYTFSISSGSSAQLYLSSDDKSENLTKIAEVLSGQLDIAPNEWERYESQRSIELPLTSGNSYMLKVIYLGHTPESHCQAAWTGPGITGTEVISPDHLVAQSFLPVGVDPSPLLAHDYDTSGQTDALWPNASDPDGNTIIAAPTGMSGQAEQITQDPGGSTDESALFDNRATDHFYASFLVQLVSGNGNVSLYFQSASSSEEGPRMELDISSSTPAIRAGGSGGTSERVFVEYDKTYRVEIIASMDTAFEYAAGLSSYIVAPDTFDYYVSDPTTGALIGSHRGLGFRDGGPDVVNELDRLRLRNFSSPNVIFDELDFTGGSISGAGYINSNQSDLPQSNGRNFYRLSVFDGDQDGDGLTDWEEKMLAGFNPFLFFDQQSSNGTDDSTALTSLLSGATGDITLSLQASDAAAFEDNSPNLGADNGEVVITRTGPLTPVTVELCVTPLETTGNTATVCNGICCTLIGSAGEEEAEVEDYTLIDENGEVVTDTIHFAFGEMTKTLTVIATPDGINEYPETLNLAVKPSDSDAYDVTEINGASIQLFDLPDSPSNNAIFTGLFSQDGNAVVPSNGSGSTTAILNGPRTQLLITSEFTNLTSNQQDAHIHKSNPGPTPGSIIYAITNVPGAEGENPPDSDPKNGPLNDYPWDISSSSGAISTSGGEASKQVIIDSLFGQNGETPLYFNVHTVSNPAGEIWSFLALTGGSATDPGAPTPADAPGSASYPQLTGSDLEAEVRRFLNQATFGATQEDVASLLSDIAAERITDPTYHRHEAFEAWIDAQMALPQTYLLDYNLATDFQQLKLRNWFDPALNPSNELYTTPPLPGTWPVVDRSNPDPEQWYLNAPHPVNANDARLADENNLGNAPGNTSRRFSHWQMMMNADDQLRQKMGFALQQIVLISASENVVRDSTYAASNYQDMLNHFAFSHFREVLGFANWNPLMGRWLSSLQNQKGLDLDGDGQDDTSPDENLARENMQLFSIGLFELWADGTLRLGSDGAPNNTYTNADIQEFAKIITGQSFSIQDSRNNGWGGVPYASIPENTSFGHSQGDSDIYGAKYAYPMKMFGEYHDRSAKTFAGTTIDNTDLTDPTAQGIADMSDALDWLAGKPGDGMPDYDMVHSHTSTPAFICRRLIQRLVTSNPSRDYLHRVATVFKDSEGNLGLTLKAILLDPEARVPDIDNPKVGMKKSPLESFIHLVRSLGAYTYVPIAGTNNEHPFDDAPGDYSNPDLYLSNFGYPQTQYENQRLNQRTFMGSTLFGTTTSLLMEPFYQETVFNWYLPDFAPSGPLANAGLVAPEMQLANEQDVVRNINYLRNIVVSTSGIGGSSLGGNSAAQTAAFNGDSGAGSYENIRVDLYQLTSEVYPSAEPTPAGGMTSEFLANEMMVDELDRRLTCGFLKQRYPYDTGDDDDPNVSGVDDLLKNPRELIIDSLTYGSNDPYDGNNDESNRFERVRDALYLLVASPEFQIRK